MVILNGPANTYKTSLYSIFLLQKKFVRIVTYSSWNAHTASKPEFDVNTLQRGTFVYQFLNILLPESFSSFFVTRSQIHCYHTGSVDLLHSQFYGTSLGQFSVTYRGPVIWSSLSASLRSHSSALGFKRVLKQVLLMAYRSI